MCQQTRIETAIPYYERFLECWPTVEDLAAAPVDEVLREWAGLGYYSRARKLHEAAQCVAQMGAFPSTAKTLQKLPGIGPYTAAAIASIAFEEDAHLVDGNVERVLSRFFGMALDTQSKEGRRALWEKARVLLPTGQARDWNQALMEWGALVCHPKNPACEICPVRRDCVARNEGRIHELPFKGKRTKAKKVYAACGLLQRGDSVLLAKRPMGGLLGGLWEFPGTEMAEVPQSDREFAVDWKGRTGVDLQGLRPLGELRHVFTHRDLCLRVLSVDGDATQVREAPKLRFVDVEDRRGLALSRLTQKVISLAGLD
jgi:A/G-specific adenine glycosylase